jgi:hypothetical protein
MYDYIHRLDFPVYFLLATGNFSFGLISHFMVDPAAFQDSGNSCGRYIWSPESYYYATCPSNTANIKQCAIPYLYLSHTFPIPFLYLSYTLLILSSYSPHTLLILSSYSPHTLPILSPYSPHTLLILSPYSPHT